MTQIETAIIQQIVIGKQERIKGICANITFKTQHGNFCNIFNMEQIDKMMKDSKCYNDTQELVGKPCQVNAGWGEECSFIEMWKG